MKTKSIDDPKETRVASRSIPPLPASIVHDSHLPAAARFVQLTPKDMHMPPLRRVTVFDPVHSSDAASSAPSFPTATPATSPPANAAEGTHGIMCEHPTAEAVFANPENGRHVDDNVHTYTNDFRSRYAATRFPSGSNASAATRTGLGGGGGAGVASREFLRELVPLASPNAAAATAAAAAVGDVGGDFLDRIAIAAAADAAAYACSGVRGFGMATSIDDRAATSIDDRVATSTDDRGDGPASASARSIASDARRRPSRRPRRRLRRLLLLPGTSEPSEPERVRHLLPDGRHPVRRRALVRVFQRSPARRRREIEHGRECPAGRAPTAATTSFADSR